MMSPSHPHFTPVSAGTPVPARESRSNALRPNALRPNALRPQAPCSVEREVPRACATRDYWMERVPESQPRHQLRVLTGLIFLVFGLMKSFALPQLMGAPGLHVTLGAVGFARFIAGLGLPFPSLTAWVVVVVEPLCGLGLILSSWTPATRLFTRMSALPMVGIMMGSLVAGVRQIEGRPVILDGFVS